MGRKDNILMVVLAGLILMTVPTMASAEAGGPALHAASGESSLILDQHETNVQGREFYLQVGRPDLAAEYRPPQTMLAGLTVMTMMGAGGWGGYIAARDSWDFLSTSLAVGVGSMGIGLPVGLMMASFAFGERHPVNVDQRQKLAATNDLKLSRELDISRAIDESAPDQPIMVRVLSISF